MVSTLVGVFTGKCNILGRFVDSLAPGSCSGELVLAIPGSGENKTSPPPSPVFEISDTREYRICLQGGCGKVSTPTLKMYMYIDCRMYLKAFALILHSMLRSC